MIAATIMEQSADDTAGASVTGVTAYDEGSYMVFISRLSNLFSRNAHWATAVWLLPHSHKLQNQPSKSTSF